MKNKVKERGMKNNNEEWRIITNNKCRMKNKNE